MSESPGITQNKNPLMICILKGSSVFFADLIREISLPLDIDFMAISSYGSRTVSGEVRLVKDLDTSIEGRNVPDRRRYCGFRQNTVVPETNPKQPRRGEYPHRFAAG